MCRRPNQNGDGSRGVKEVGPASRAGRSPARLAGPTAVTLIAVVSSPAVRCVQTVEPLAAALGLEVELDDRLAEGGGSSARVLLEEDGVVACTHGDVIFELLGYGLKKARYVVFD